MHPSPSDPHWSRRSAWTQLMQGLGMPQAYQKRPSARIIIKYDKLGLPNPNRIETWRNNPDV
jgi:hypothetical protein